MAIWQENHKKENTKLKNMVLAFTEKLACEA